MGGLVRLAAHQPVMPAEASPPEASTREGESQARGPHTPEMACTATRRKPFTSPFSLTMATRCTRGTGYSRLLRYTKALGEERLLSGPAWCVLRAAAATVRPSSRHNTAKRAERREAGQWAAGGQGDRQRLRCSEDTGGGRGRALGQRQWPVGWHRAQLGPHLLTDEKAAEEGFSLLQGGGPGTWPH